MRERREGGTLLTEGGRDKKKRHIKDILRVVTDQRWGEEREVDKIDPVGTEGWRELKRM